MLGGVYMYKKFGHYFFYNEDLFLRWCKNNKYSFRKISDIARYEGFSSYSVSSFGLVYVPIFSSNIVEQIHF